MWHFCLVNFICCTVITDWVTYCSYPGIHFTDISSSHLAHLMVILISNENKLHHLSMWSSSRALLWQVKQPWLALMHNLDHRFHEGISFFILAMNNSQYYLCLKSGILNKTLLIQDETSTKIFPQKPSSCCSTCYDTRQDEHTTFITFLCHLIISDDPLTHVLLLVQGSHTSFSFDGSEKSW